MNGRHERLTYGDSKETEVDDLLREAFGIFFPGEIHACTVPLDDARLDDVVADGLMQWNIWAAEDTSANAAQREEINSSCRLRCFSTQL